MAEHVVVLGQGAQALRHVPTDALARPTAVASASFTLVDLSKPTTSPDRVLASGSVTVDGASSALTADAGPSSSAYPERLSVADASQFTEGRIYLLTKDDGLREMVTAVRVDPESDHVYGKFAVRGEYESGDELVGLQISCLFPADEANDQDTARNVDHPGYQVTWQYEIDDREYMVGELVRVSPYTTQPLIDASDILMVLPSLAKRAKDVDGAVLCAHQDFFAELEAGGRDPSLVRTGNSGRVAVRYLALHYLMLGMHGDDDRETADRFYQRYKELLHRILNAGDPPRDVVVLSQSDDVPTKDRFSDLFKLG